MNDFLKDMAGKIKQSDVKDAIVSMILFGSVDEGAEQPGSDIDICVVVKKSTDKKRVEDMLFEINSQTMLETGMRIEPYIKTVQEFKRDKNLGVLKSVQKSNQIIWGSDLGKIK